MTQLWILVLVLAIFGAVVVWRAMAATTPANTVYRSGASLMLNGAKYQFVGFNAFGITGCEGSAWSRAQLDSYFAQLPPASMTRLWATELYGTGTLDQVVASAEAHNQKLVMTLNNDTNDCVIDGAKNNAWYQSGYKNGGYLAWVNKLTTRYKDSPAIGMWEVINEAGQSQGEGKLDGTTMKNFYQDVATKIKAVDPNHLVATGENADFNYSGGTSAYQTAASAASIDVMSMHDYASDYGAPGVMSPSFSGMYNASKAVQKPIMIGEINDNGCAISHTTRANNVKASITAYLNAGAAGALIWNRSMQYYNECPGGEDYIVATGDPLISIVQQWVIPGVVPVVTGSTPAPTLAPTNTVTPAPVPTGTPTPVATRTPTPVPTVVSTPKPTATSTPTSVTHGLKGTYFASKTLSGTSKTRTDATVNFNWGSGAPMSGIPADYWSARWTGRVTAPTTGWYGFYLRGDDGMRLSVNNQLIIDKWYNQAATATHLGWVFLNGGQNYPIKLEYYENRGNASVMMSWEGPDFATQLVPSRVLTP